MFFKIWDDNKISSWQLVLSVWQRRSSNALSLWPVPVVSLVLVAAILLEPLAASALKAGRVDWSMLKPNIYWRLSNWITYCCFTLTHTIYDIPSPFRIIKVTSPMVAFCSMQNVIPSELHRNTSKDFQIIRHSIPATATNALLVVISCDWLQWLSFANCGHMARIDVDVCWWPVFARESYLPRLVFEGSTWTGSACEECGVWRVIGWDWASVTSQGSRQSQGNNFWRLLEQVLASNLGEWPVPRTRPQHGFTSQLFVTVEVFKHHLCVEASIGRLLVSNFTLLTLPQFIQLCSSFSFGSFSRNQRTPHMPPLKLRSSWPVKQPRPFPKNHCSEGPTSLSPNPGLLLPGFSGSGNHPHLCRSGSGLLPDQQYCDLQGFNPLCHHGSLWHAGTLVALSTGL